MALNVEQITSRLAQMPDAALQKYAAMNKNDPYIMALAVSESNRRKQMRQAAQGQQGQMPQPKVVDQAVQGMAAPMPEEMGIARLPAGEMNFADGGIVAFADGGEVERYQVGGLPPLSSGTEYGVEGMATGSLYQQAMAKAQQGKPLSDVEKALLASATPLAAVADTAMLPITALRKLVRSPLDKSEEPSWFPLTGAATSKLASEMPPQASYSNESRRTPNAAGLAAAAAQPAIDRPAPKVDTAQRGLGSVITGAPKAPAAADTGLAALDPAKLYAAELTRLGGESRPEKSMLEALNKDRTAAAEKELESERALEKRFADAFKGQRERLEAREGELGRMKDQSFGLALLQAGAAMMSTPGSVGTAVGKGIQAGSQQYVAGIDKLNAAKDKLADARDRLDALQLNRDEMSARAIQKAENKIRDTAIAGQENMIRYVMERDKVDRETAAKIVDNQIQIGLTQAGFANRENVARISAAPALERNAMMRLAQSKDDKVRAEYGKLQAKVMDTLSKDDNYKMATPAQQQVMQTNALRQALMSNPFLSSYAANVGFSSTPAGGKVYDLTGD